MSPCRKSWISYMLNVPCPEQANASNGMRVFIVCSVTLWQVSRDSQKKTPSSWLCSSNFPQALIAVCIAQRSMGSLRFEIRTGELSLCLFPAWSPDYHGWAAARLWRLFAQHFGHLLPVGSVLLSLLDHEHSFHSGGHQFLAGFGHVAQALPQYSYGEALRIWDVKADAVHLGSGPRCLAVPRAGLNRLSQR